MADLRRMELDELVTRPGTYVNPDTEVVVVVDDGGHVDAELLAGDDGEWVVVSDEVPVDDHRRDELLERLQARASSAGAAHDDDHDAPGDDGERRQRPDLVGALHEELDRHDGEDDRDRLVEVAEPLDQALDE